MQLYNFTKPFDLNSNTYNVIRDELCFSFRTKFYLLIQSHSVALTNFQQLDELQYIVSRKANHQKNFTKPIFLALFTAYWKFLDSWVHQKWQVTINCIFPHYRFEEKYWLQPAFKTPGNIVFSSESTELGFAKAAWVNILICTLKGICEGLK